MQVGWTTHLWPDLSLIQGPDTILECHLQIARHISLETPQVEVNLVLASLSVPLYYWIHHDRRT